jgi:hypothetical protein
MSDIKVLPAPSWLLWDLNDPDEAEMLNDTLSSLREVKPIFNRTGWYYNRITETAWYEAHGKAWVCDRKDDFLYELALQDHRPLTPKQREAIKTLKYAGLADKKLCELLWLDSEWFYLRSIRRDTNLVLYRKEWT